MDTTRLREAFRQRPMAEVVETLCELEAAARAVHAAQLEAIADIDARQGWRADGCCSMVDWLCFRLQCSRKTAHEWVDAARALDDLPYLARSYAEADLSWAKAQAVATLATDASDEALTREAIDADVKSLERAARKARAISLTEANRRHRDRFFALRRSITMGGVRLSGFLPDVDGETLIKAIERLADDAPKDPDTGLYPNFNERCADALVDMASQVLAGQQPAHGERAMVVAHVDVPSEQNLVRTRDTGLRPETESGMPLCEETVVRLMCDAVIEPVLERDGRTVGRGKKQRFPEPWMRRQVLRRDNGCRFPGCCRTRGLHAHHIKHWPGGPTEPRNLVMLCRYHHRLVHEGAWRIRGDPEGPLEFIRPDGRPFSVGLGAEGSLAKRALGNILATDNEDGAEPGDDAGETDAAGDDAAGDDAAGDDAAGDDAAGDDAGG